MEILMTYTANSAPGWVKNMPVEARTAWLRAYNTSFEAEKGEVHAVRVASSVVKKMGYTLEEKWWVKNAEAAEEFDFVEFVEHYDPDAWLEDLQEPGVVGYKGEGGEKGERCLECKWFLVPNECILVKPPIAPQGICDLFTDKPNWMESRVDPSIAETVQTMKVRAVMESIDLSEAKVNGDVIENVAMISPGWSLNGRYYGKKQIAEAAPAWEFTRAYANHDMSGANRSIFEQVGYYKGVRIDANGRMRSNLHLVGDPAKKTHIRDWAQASIDEGQMFMGLSIVAACEVENGEAEGRKGVLIKKIINPYSTDVVTDPAAGGGFDLITASRSGDAMTALLLQNVSFEQWKALNPDFTAKMREELKQVRQEKALEERDVQIKTLTDERDQAVTKMAEAQATLEAKDTVVGELETKVKTLNTQIAAAEAFKASKLPTALYEDIFPVLVAAGEVAKMAEVIATEERKLIKLTTGVAVKIEGAGQKTVEESTDEKTAEDLGYSTDRFGNKVLYPMAGESVLEFTNRKKLAEARTAS